MKGPMHGTVHDPTQFLFVPLIRHPAVEAPRAAELRQRCVQRALDQSLWIPGKDSWHGSENDEGSILQRNWEQPPTDPSLGNGWSAQSYGITYHEILAVLLGVEQHAPR